MAVVRVSLSGLTVKSGSNDKKTVLSWNAVSSPFVAASYEVYVDKTCYKATARNITLNNLTPGKHSFYVVAIDKNGNRITSDETVSFTLKDTTAPQKLTGVEAAISSTALTTLTWNPGVDNDAVARYEVVVNGKKYSTTTNSVSIKNLATGKYTATVYAYDKAKNKSVAASYAFTVSNSVGTQYVGQTKFLVADYDDDSMNDQKLDKILQSKAVTPMFKVSNGNDVVKVNANTFAYFKGNINTGAGNDLFIVAKNNPKYGAGAWIYGNVNFGAGNNKLEVYTSELGFYSKTLYFGNGNNVIKCSNGSEIEIGTPVYVDGDRQYVAKGTGKIVFGNGKNTINVTDGSDFEGSMITFGNGGNSINVSKGGWFATEVYWPELESNPESKWWNTIVKYNGNISKIQFGSGLDKITLTGTRALSANMTGIDSDYCGTLQTFELNMGAGKDYITLKKGGFVDILAVMDNTNKLRGGTVYMGNDNDKITLIAGSLFQTHTLDMGNGDDVINAKGTIACHNLLKMGNGNDQFYANAEMSIGDIDLGAGNDKMVVYKKLNCMDLSAASGNNILNVKADFVAYNLTLGNGNDQYYANGISNVNSVDLGAGNDKMTVYKSLTTTDVDTGAGDDILNVKNNFECDDLNLGAGNDQFYANADMSLGQVDLGAGNDRMYVYKNVYCADLNLGIGTDTLVISGTLTLGDGAALSSVENVSGAGRLIVQGSISQADYDRFSNAGITVEASMIA